MPERVDLATEPCTSKWNDDLALQDSSVMPRHMGFRCRAAPLHDVLKRQQSMSIDRRTYDYAIDDGISSLPDK